MEVLEEDEKVYCISYLFVVKSSNVEEEKEEKK